jgi:signal transduction histidine kinase
VTPDSAHPFVPRSQRPSLALSVVLFAGLVGGMAYVRLGLFGHTVITLGYGWPLLVCLWQRDRRLLWATTFGFLAIIVAKSVQLPTENDTLNNLFHVVNTLVVAGVVHAFIGVLDRLEQKRFVIERAHAELSARQEEISRQNEELHAQAEELAQQNEQIQQQSEEVQHQAEEITAQAEELQEANSLLVRREALLQTLLNSLRLSAHAEELPARVCEPLQTLFGPVAAAVAIVEKVGDDLVMLAHRGPRSIGRPHWPFAHTFAAVVMAEDRTAFIEDLERRPDIAVPHPEAGRFRSVLATPLRLNGRPIGAIKIYSEQPRQWSAEEFRIVEWVSAQCTLIMECQRLRAELAKSNRELDTLVHQRTAELQEIVNDLEHFSYTITHDLRAPLRAMHGFAAMLDEDCRDQLSAESRDYIRRITTAAARMDRLITDALSYSGTVRQEFTMEPTDPAKLLRGMIESYPMFQEPAAHIAIDGELPMVLGNEAALTQCFSNLLGNAVKFVAPGVTPRVRVHAERRGEFVRLWFEDNGIGIPPGMQARLFAMFQRLNKSYEGTGIGLALVKKVTSRMGGAVGVESEPGRGSRFWLELRAA